MLSSFAPHFVHAQERQTLPEDPYERVRDIVFPRFTDDFSDLKHFIMALRILPVYEPEFQINIIERNNGKFEAVIYTLPEGSRGIEFQLDHMPGLTGSETVEDLAKRIKVEKRVIKDTAELRRLVKSFSELRINPQLDTRFSLHYIEYDLWYRAISNEVHFTLAGSDVDGDPNNHPIVQWMNEVQKTLIPKSVSKTRAVKSK
jgi:hypothetical protein